MDHPAQAEPGPRPDTQPSRLVPAVPAEAAVGAGSPDPTGDDDADRELSDEDYARYEPL